MRDGVGGAGLQPALNPTTEETFHSGEWQHRVLQGGLLEIDPRRHHQVTQPGPRGRARIPTPREVFIAWSWGRRMTGVGGVLRQWACVSSALS